VFGCCNSPLNNKNIDYHCPVVFSLKRVFPRKYCVHCVIAFIVFVVISFCWFYLFSIESKISEEVWTRHSCDYSNMRIFGCDAYALISKDQHSKLDPRSKKCLCWLW
jgi:hypothetical protein